MRGNRMLRSVLARLSEPSTYAGLAGLAVLAGVRAEEWIAWSSSAAVICSLMAVALKEQQSGKK